MVYTSPSRRYVSKHTSYPTAHADKTYMPSEVSTATRASLKNTENEFRQIQNAVRNVHRKSLSQLESQRKLLEKSMLEYSNKMKEINDSRTNELFREIHTRNATRSNDGTRKGSSHSDSASFKSFASYPRSLRAQHRSRRGKSLSQIAVPSPILEVRETPDRTQRPLSTHHLRLDRSSSPKLIRSARSMVTNIKIVFDSSSNTSDVDLTNESKSGFYDATANGYLTVPALSTRKPRVARAKFPWSPSSDSADSAYSSGTDDVEDSSVTSASSYTSDLTVKIMKSPKIHKRRRYRKSHRSPSIHID
ncbi:hypothetical protein DPMN_114870 [Dreissena polymorpha]|uniref:Uncharacterized protein n=1 Tax=Dreissena polymorpha TaxID=45954 RepID=A0A9D4KLF1_DREPO|nr:hypothetical protein DPMN_114870 [Dreissena polymorpha]